MSSKSICAIFVPRTFFSLHWYDRLARYARLLCGNIAEKLDPWIRNPLGPASARAVSRVYDTSSGKWRRWRKDDDLAGVKQGAKWLNKSVGEFVVSRFSLTAEFLTANWYFCENNKGESERSVSFHQLNTFNRYYIFDTLYVFTCIVFLNFLQTTRGPPIRIFIYWENTGDTVHRNLNFQINN